MKKGIFSCLVVTLIVTLLSSGCSTMNNLSKGAIIGTAGGGAAGAGIGAIIGGKKGAAIGAAIGAGVGAGSGILIGRKMDKQKAELEKIEGAKVEEISDANNLKAIKVTFSDGILFATGKSELSLSSRNALSEFARSLNASPDTDVLIVGHTDNTGSRDVNSKLSKDRATAVANFLKGQGVNSLRLATDGLAFDSPVADNSTATGRTANRRVEIFISANANMIKKAEAGNL